MPWRCPACQVQIVHNEFEDRPRLGERYRCHICRLELVVDPETHKFVVAPLSPSDREKRERSTH